MSHNEQTTSGDVIGVAKRLVDRYKEFELRNSSLEKRLFSGPTGLGTSAARFGSLLGAGRTESGLHSIDDSLPATRLSDLSLSQSPVPNPQSPIPNSY